MIKTKQYKFINPTLSFLALFSITRRQAASAIAANLTFMPQKHFFRIFKLLNRFFRQWFVNGQQCHVTSYARNYDGGKLGSSDSEKFFVTIMKLINATMECN